jgi:hypothetical protein
METEGFDSNVDNSKDQKLRQERNVERTYTDSTRCDWCQALGAPYQCLGCNSFLCDLHICIDGCCPECTGSGKEGHDD